MTPTTITEVLDRHAENWSHHPPHIALIESIRSDLEKLELWTIGEITVEDQQDGGKIARTPIGIYHFHPFTGDRWGVHLAGLNSGKIWGSLDQAKVAAQEHFNKTMRPGLTKAI